MFQAHEFNSCLIFSFFLLSYFCRWKCCVSTSTDSTTDAKSNCLLHVTKVKPFLLSVFHICICAMKRLIMSPSCLFILLPVLSVETFASANHRIHSEPKFFGGMTTRDSVVLTLPKNTSFPPGYDYHWFSCSNALPLSSNFFCVPSFFWTVIRKTRGTEQPPFTDSMKMLLPDLFHFCHYHHVITIIYLTVKATFLISQIRTRRTYSLVAWIRSLGTLNVT